MNTTMSNKVAPSENGYVRDEPKEVYKIAFNKYDDFLIAYHSEDGNDNYIITKGNGNNCDFTILDILSALKRGDSYQFHTLRRG